MRVLSSNTGLQKTAKVALSVCVWLCTGVMLLRAATANANDSDPCLCLTPVVGELYSPVEYLVVKRHDDLLLTLLVEQRGLVRAFTMDNKERSQPFMDIRTRVTTSARHAEERGLLSVALHTNYTSSSQGLVFAYYVTTVDGTDYAYVSEFQATDDVVAVTSERYLLRVKQPADRGNGGQLLFGDDGYLYVFTGDGTGMDNVAAYAQDPQLFLGKALRIDVNKQGFQYGLSGSALTYFIPPDNPFANNNTYRPEIFALGFRNPWRCSQDSASRGGTGAIYCGDAGSDRFEEINIVTSGRNYGWNLKEGDYCFNAQNCSRVETTSAIYTYPYNKPNGSAVVGGYVYRGGHFSQLVGNFIYGDVISGRTFLLQPSTLGGQTRWTSVEWSMCEESRCPCHARHPRQPFLLAFGLHADGELMLLTATDLFAESALGSLLRVVAPTGTITKPVTCGCSDVSAATPLMTLVCLAFVRLWSSY